MSYYHNKNMFLVWAEDRATKATMVQPKTIMATDRAQARRLFIKEKS